MDYCEWKNGYRVEAMTGAARGLILKIQNILMTSLKSFILAKIGYVQGVKIGTQSDSAKWWLFALGTGIPIITSAFGILPKFLYPINKNLRERMYDELSVRRKLVASEITSDAQISEAETKI